MRDSRLRFRTVDPRSHVTHITMVQKRKGEATGLPDQVKILPQTWGGRVSSSHINRETDLVVGGHGGGPPVPMGKSLWREMIDRCVSGPHSFLQHISKVAALRQTGQAPHLSTSPKHH